jgi:hypothetical protein
MFTSDIFENTIIIPNVWDLKRKIHLEGGKCIGLRFWANFSQTDLATLPLNPTFELQKNAAKDWTA